MSFTRYPEPGRAAILLICLLSVLASCAPPREQVPVATPFHKAVAPEPAEKLIKIRLLMTRAMQGEYVDEALAGLAEMAEQETGAVAEEAAFRRVQLLLHFNYPDSAAAAEQVVELFPENALVPYVDLWLARWWDGQNDDSQVLAHTSLALRHARLNREVAGEAVQLGLAAARHSADWDAVKWLFTAAGAIPDRRDNLLQEAAMRASLSIITRLREAGWLQPDMYAFYVYAARNRLLRGQISELQAIAGFLQKDAPGSDALASVRRWSLGAMHSVTIGVLLPLSGTYARFGEQALRGVRLATALLGEGGQITLRVEDTGGKPASCTDAYRRLIDDGVAMVVGPLLAPCAEALLPHLTGHVPVLSLTRRTEIAQGSPQMFVHSLSLPAQARFMADDAWQQSDRHIVLISGAQPLSRQEADAFAQQFQALGGEIVETIELPANKIDFRRIFSALRSRTDDEELLAALDEDMAFLADSDMDIRMPASFDGIYLALSGKQVALVSGQLAYADMAGVNLYGSGHWRDGHLLDDKGRYLDKSRFSDVGFPTGNMAELHRMLLAYREVWGREKPGKLMGLAYDSALIAAMLTSRMGLSGNALEKGLADKSGFPGLTGHVYFDNSGAGQKRFNIFTIRRNHILPAG